MKTRGVPPRRPNPPRFLNPWPRPLARAYTYLLTLCAPCRPQVQDCLDELVKPGNAEGAALLADVGGQAAWQALLRELSLPRREFY